VRPWRRIAFGTAVLSLLGIGLRPTWPRPVSTDEAVLVTPGADAGAVSRLADSLGTTAVFVDPADIGSITSLRRLHVVGWGLEPSRWPELGTTPVVIHAAPPPVGLARVSWNTNPVLGDGLEIEGRVSGLAEGATVALIDPAGRIDSVHVKGDGAFQLDTRPNGAGRQMYVLQAGPITHPVVRETLAVNVVPPPPHRLLVLEATPSFETSALRDWLARRGGSIGIRTAVSRDRYRTEFVNQDRFALTPLTDRLLARFDIAQIDGQSLAALTASERAVLRRAVSEHGLGLLVLPDTAVFDSNARFSDRGFFFDFALHRVVDLEERSVHPSWASLVGAPERATTVPAAPYLLRDHFGVEPLIEDGAGGIVAQVVPRGKGMIGTSLVTGSARWLRTGKGETYSAYWSTLFAAVTGGRATGLPTVETAGPWLVHRPVTVSVVGADSSPLAVVTTPSGARDSIFLSADPLRPDVWLGVFWPREPGWHEVGGAAFFVQPAESWQAHQASERLDAMAGHATFQEPARTAIRSAPVPVPPIWFFGLFLLSVAVLWSARRPLLAVARSATGIAS